MIPVNVYVTKLKTAKIKLGSDLDEDFTKTASHENYRLYGIILKWTLPHITRKFLILVSFLKFPTPGDREWVFNFISIDLVSGQTYMFSSLQY